eukprot:8668470-Pyramimonas_sp.AAC.1
MAAVRAAAVAHRWSCTRNSNHAPTQLRVPRDAPPDPRGHFAVPHLTRAARGRLHDRASVA